MYEVVVGNKTVLTTNDKAEALRRAETAFQTHNYVEVKEVVTISPWYARSVKILYR